VVYVYSGLLSLSHGCSTVVLPCGAALLLGAVLAPSAASVLGVVLVPSTALLLGEV
jgi:hypothetical protein